MVFLTALLGGCGYGSYEECLLGEMKGQVQSMEPTAEKMCENEFPYEKEIYSFRDGKWDIAWTTALSDQVKIEVRSNETRYRITRAKIAFSTIECAKAKASDFNHALSFNISPGKSASAYSAKASNFKCMRENSVYGILEN